MAELAYTVKEAAQALGVSESTIYWMVYRNEIPHRRIKARGTRGKGKILIPRAALEEWLGTAVSSLDCQGAVKSIQRSDQNFDTGRRCKPCTQVR
ncbi:MAG: helix-turn-helix domain-containing protein [Bacillota bacterium]